ncbi:hypothetical protein OKX59_06280 [Lactobacillus delbrueckii subsp. indicus]|uniref:hypothetical protein n=1 Tax=Lactobacillus delbrueckii TaxID=1584 RepID=UPI002223130F|nr:hypothetical protein [Lactobacillus delbrueckii]UYX12190.1 hypothetical protein OJ966_06615 [Lactobacillus delbrueckii]UYY84000.1 hypothetical protein OKX59_06280 [Lactobacillus delbrueckii subsp. indicus]
MKRLKSLAFVYASIFSLLIGLGAGIFLTISSELISLFWSKRTLTHPGLLLLQCLLSSYLLWSGAFTMWDLVDQAAKLGPDQLSLWQVPLDQLWLWPGLERGDHLPGDLLLSCLGDVS